MAEMKAATEQEKDLGQPGYVHALSFCNGIFIEQTIQFQLYFPEEALGSF